MPRASVWFIRTALIYLALGFTFGGLLLFNKAVPILPVLWGLLPIHVEFVLAGWTFNLALGMAYWILPRFVQGPPRGDVRLIGLAYVLLNAGVLVASTAAVLPTTGAGLLLAGRAAELLSAVVFACHAWPRVRPMNM